MENGPLEDVFPIAMLVYQSICQKKKLPIRRFQLLEDVVPGGRAHGPQVAVPWTKMYDEKVKLTVLEPQEISKSDF